MDDTVNRLAKELAQAIRAAVAADPTVEACRAKARAAGYEMHLSIDAEVGFANRAKPTAVVKVRRAGAGAVSASGGTTQPNTPAGPIGFSSASTRRREQPRDERPGAAPSGRPRALGQRSPVPQVAAHRARRTARSEGLSALGARRSR